MIDLTKIYLFIFGALTIAGGVMGYVKAGSPASIIAGGISGILLLVSGYLVGAGKVQAGLILGIVLCLPFAARLKTGLLWKHRVLTGLIALLILVISTAFLVTQNYNPFLYFRF